MVILGHHAHATLTAANSIFYSWNALQRTNYPRPEHSVSRFRTSFSKRVVDGCLETKRSRRRERVSRFTTYDEEVLEQAGTTMQVRMQWHNNSFSSAAET